MVKCGDLGDISLEISTLRTEWTKLEIHCCRREQCSILHNWHQFCLLEFFFVGVSSTYLQVNCTILLPNSFNKETFCLTNLNLCLCDVVLLFCLKTFSVFPWHVKKSGNSLVWHWKPWLVSRYNLSCPISQPMPQPIKFLVHLPLTMWVKPVRLCYFNSPCWSILSWSLTNHVQRHCCSF